MSFRPANKPVKLPGGAVPPRVYRVEGFGSTTEVDYDEETGKVTRTSENDVWYSLGPVLYNAKVLSPILKTRVEKRIVKRSDDDWMDAYWPPQKPRIRLGYVTTIKENGVVYLIYRNRRVVRYVPKFLQPPKYLFISPPSAMQHPLLTTEESKPEYVFDKLGRVRLPRQDQMHALADHPDHEKASMYVMPMRMPLTVADRGAVELGTADAVHEFESTRATPEFRSWFEGASASVRNKDDSPKVFYRGQTTSEGGLKSRLEMDSFTDSSEIASIYSTQNGTVGEGASVLPVYIDVKNPLEIPYGTLVLTDYLTYLGWHGNPFESRRLTGGITDDEVMEVLKFLNKRKAAAAAGSSMFGLPTRLPKSLRPFQGMPAFKIATRPERDLDDTYDLDEDEMFDLDPGLNFDGVSPLDVLQDEWEMADPEQKLRLSMLLGVDTFALVETPVTKRVLKRLGYDGVIHKDMFAAKDAAKKLLNKELEDVEGIEEGEEDWDFDEEMSYEHGHWTIRPLDRSQVWPILGDQPVEPVKMAARAVKAALLAIAV